MYKKTGSTHRPRLERARRLVNEAEQVLRNSRRERMERIKDSVNCARSGTPNFDRACAQIAAMADREDAARRAKPRPRFEHFQRRFAVLDAATSSKSESTASAGLDAMIRERNRRGLYTRKDSSRGLVVYQTTIQKR